MLAALGATAGLAVVQEIPAHLETQATPGITALAGQVALPEERVIPARLEMQETPEITVQGVTVEPLVEQETPETPALLATLEQVVAVAVDVAVVPSTAVQFRQRKLHLTHLLAPVMQEVPEQVLLVAVMVALALLVEPPL